LALTVLNAVSLFPLDGEHLTHGFPLKDAKQLVHVVVVVYSVPIAGQMNVPQVTGIRGPGVVVPEVIPLHASIGIGLAIELTPTLQACVVGLARIEETLAVLGDAGVVAAVSLRERPVDSGSLI